MADDYPHVSHHSHHNRPDDAVVYPPSHGGDFNFPPPPPSATPPRYRLHSHLLGIGETQFDDGSGTHSTDEPRPGVDDYPHVAHHSHHNRPDDAYVYRPSQGGHFNFPTSPPSDGDNTPPQYRLHPHLLGICETQFDDGSGTQSTDEPGPGVDDYPHVAHHSHHNRPDDAYVYRPSQGGDFNFPTSPPSDGDNTPPQYRLHPHLLGIYEPPSDDGSGTHSTDEPRPGVDGPELAHPLETKPSHRIICRAGGDGYCFAIRDGKVVLTHLDDSDLTQHWCKDERYSTKVKDKDGYPSFILVNKGTGQAIKHSVSCHPVQLSPYHPDVLDESLLWTEGKDRGSGFRTIRTVNNVGLVMDAWNADKDHGGIHDGTVIALSEAWKGDNENQQWKLVHH